MWRGSWSARGREGMGEAPDSEGSHCHEPAESCGLSLQARREPEEYYRLFGVPAQTNQDSFRYKRAAFYSGINGLVGLIFSEAAALRININTDGSPVAMGRAHITHASMLLASSPPPFLNTSSLPAPEIKCPVGLLFQWPSALAICSTLLLFLSPTLSPRYSTLFSCNTYICLCAC